MLIESLVEMQLKSKVVFFVLIYIYEVDCIIQVDEFSERQGGVKEYGLVGQSFVTALREELAEYYQLLSVLEAEVNRTGQDMTGLE